MASLYMLPLSLVPQFFTNLGIVAQSATITTLVAGTVSTLCTTYADSSGNVPNPNPLTVNAAGRAANTTSGAMVAFWVPAGTTVDVYFADPQGDTWVIRNMSAINDPAAQGSLQILLASPANSNASGQGPVAGADLVANAVKSYDVFADLRAANTPVLQSGQTLSIQVQGGLAINDGLGGDFYWNATATGTDNGATIINPTSNTGNGRWLRLYTPPFSGPGTVAAGATTDIGSTGANIVLVNGSGQSISNFGNTASANGPLYFIKFNGVNTINQGENQIFCPGGISITTAAGDWCIASYAGQASGWTIMAYFPVLANDIQHLVQAADQSVTSSTSPVTATNLQTNLPAGATMLVQLRLRFVGATTTTQGYNFQLTTSGGFAAVGPTLGIGVMSSNETTSTIISTTNNSIPNGAISDGVGDMVSMDFILVVGTAGAIGLQFSQNSSSANATTLKAGSAMIVTRIA